MVKRLLLAALGWLIACGAAQAVCVTPLTGNDAGGVTRQFLTVLDASSNCIGTTIIVDGTAGANKTAVKAASTAAVATDPALVVAVSPNNTVGVTQATAANLNATVVGTGTFATQSTLSAETTKVIGTVRNLGNAGAIFDFAGQNASSPANSILMGGQFNTTPTTITTGNASPLQLDASGNLKVNIQSGGGSGGTSSSFSAAFPATGTAIGAKNGSNMVNLVADGSGNLLAGIANGASQAAVKAGNTGGTTDVALIVADPNVLAALNGATPAGTNRIGFTTLQTDTTGGATSFHALSAASNNSTSVKGSAGTVYSLTITQTTTTLGDFRFYDSASAPTCSSGTGVIANYAIQSNATSPGLHLTFPYGKAFANGIGFCLTGAVSDSDNTNFVTGAQINIEWK